MQLLLVINSKLGPILHHSRDTAGFLPPHPYSTKNLGGIGVGFRLNQIADVAALRNKDPQLISR